MSKEEMTAKEALEARRLSAMREHQLSDDFRGIMATDGGRRFVWFMLQEFGAFKAMPIESHAQMAYMEGRRNVGLMLISKIQADCPERYQQMILENTTKTEKGN